jgi:adenine-specific DNA-methyltransferase
MAQPSPNSSSPRLGWASKPVAIERPSLPFQIVETVNESRATREAEKDTLFRESKASVPIRNRLIWGDNKLVMASLLRDYAARVDLIYVDPPFATGADFSYEVKIGSAKVAKQPSVLEETAYRDTWGRGLDSYLSMMYERLVLMYDLLAESGSFYIHLDYRVVHYLKVVLDEIFGPENFIREIIWRIGWISGYKAKAKNWARNHDTILFYAKDRNSFTFNKQLVEHDPNYKRGAYGSDDMESVEVLDEEGEPTADGIPIDDVWVNLPSIQIMSFSGEKSGFPTQKNLDLLQRIIFASSNPGDLVADFFCGSGTTLVAAERLGRKWIGCDLGRFGVHTTRKRLLDTPGCAPFEVLNLGQYERQHWQQATTGGEIEAYLKFILSLYDAESVNGYRHIHGKKASRLVHIGAVDAPVTIDEIEQVMDEVAGYDFSSLDVLGWEWEMGLHDVIAEEARRRGLDLACRQIPREVMKASVGDEVRFFELAYLDLQVDRNGHSVRVQLRDFVIPSDELIPDAVRKKISAWSDYIDYWAVDFNFRDDTFHNEWQAYRTRKEPMLEVESDWHDYESSGRFAVVVKVIDIFGNDTTQLREVVIK